MAKKRIMNMSIDSNVADYHLTKNRGHVSSMVEDYLRALMGSEYDEGLKDKTGLIAAAEADLAKLRTEQLHFQKEKELQYKKELTEELKIVVDRMRTLYTRVIDGDKEAQKEYYPLFEKAIRVNSLSRRQLLDYIEGKKEVR